MQRNSVLRIITTVVAVVVIMMLFGMTRLHSQNDNRHDPFAATTTTPSILTPPKANPIPVLAPNEVKKSETIETSIKTTPELRQTKNEIKSIAELSDLSLEQLPSKNIINHQEGIQALEDTPDKKAQDSDTPSPRNRNDDKTATPPKHALSDMILNRELPGYTGGAGLLPGTRWRPSYDYHPHTNIHDTLLFLHRYYDRIKGLSNVTNSAEGVYSQTNTQSKDSLRRRTTSILEFLTPAVLKQHSTESSSTNSPSTVEPKELKMDKSHYQKEDSSVSSSASSASTNFPVYEDYTDRQLNQLIHCPNQTTCTSPVLQLQRSYNVYFCKHIANGVRFFYLIREGLLLHPKIHLVDDMFAADVIVYLPESARWHRSECRDPRIRHKIVVLDEGDGPQMFRPPPEEDAKFLAALPQSETLDMGSSSHKQFLLYFKRSYVRRDNGVFNGYMAYATREMNVLPMFYPVATAYLRHPVLPHSDRDLEIVCSLRGSQWDPTRQRIKEWTQEYVQARGLPKDKVRVGELNSESRTTVSKGYFQAMYSAKIVVTSNPSHWEGDFRLMEAMASGALVFVDELFVPRPSVPLHGQHIVYFNNKDKVAFFDLLDTYRAGFGTTKDTAADKVAVSYPLSRIAQTVVDITSNRTADNTENVQFLRGSGQDTPSSHRRHLTTVSQEAFHRRRLAESSSNWALSPSERIAYRGYIHSLRFLRTDSLIDYVFRTLHIFELENRERVSSSVTMSEDTPVKTPGKTPGKTPPKTPPKKDNKIVDMLDAIDAHLWKQHQLKNLARHKKRKQDTGHVSPLPQEISLLEKAIVNQQRVSGHSGPNNQQSQSVSPVSQDIHFLGRRSLSTTSTSSSSSSTSSSSGSVDALGKLDPKQRNYRVSQDRAYGSSPLYGYNAEHGFAMRWRAIPKNGNPTKPAGVVAPGSSKGTEEILASIK